MRAIHNPWISTTEFNIWLIATPLKMKQRCASLILRSLGGRFRNGIVAIRSSQILLINCNPRRSIHQRLAQCRDDERVETDHSLWIDRSTAPNLGRP